MTHFAETEEMSPLPEPTTTQTDPVTYDADETYGGDGFVWPYKARPRQWDHSLGAYPPGPGRPRGTRRADLSGEVFGRLTVLERIDDHVTPSGTKHPKYACRCLCGTTVEALGTNLKAGKVKTCGCMSAELRAEWREKERDRQREHSHQSVERYEAWKDSDERRRQDNLLRKAARARNGLI